MKITKQRIVRTALELLDEVGLDGLTLRRIAEELDVKAPALYWHLSSKEELLDEMATMMFTDAIAQVEGLSGSWQQQLRNVSSFLRELMLSHRDGAKIFGGSYITDTKPGEQIGPVVAAMIEAGMTKRQAAVTLATMLHYTVGFAIEEQEVFPVRGQRAPRYDRAQQGGDDELHDLLFGTDTDARFAAGLDLVIAGATASIADR